MSEMSQLLTLPENSVFSVTEVAKFRNETAGTKNVTHLNNAGSGLMPDVVTKAQLDHIKLESEIGGYEAAALRADAVKNFYEQCALLFNCNPQNIAFTASATDSYTRALSSIPFEKGDVILTDCDGYVSNQIQFLSLQKKTGIKIIHIRNAESGGIDVNDLRERLHQHTPKLLAITHIPTNSGLIQPVQEIARLYKSYRETIADKTWYILDACQSAGQMKLDIQQLQCDFLSITCRKFLRGPRGTGALYIADRALQNGLEPLFIDMRGADWIEKGSYKQKPDARRFEDWEFAYSAIMGTKAAIEYCREIGENKIWQQVKLLSDVLRKKLSAMDGLRLLDRGAEQGALVTFTVEGYEADFIVTELLKRKINVVASYRANGVIDFDEKGVKSAVRASLHYYNTLNEIELFVDALKEIFACNTGRCIA